MSQHKTPNPDKATVKTIKKLKGVRPIVAVTAYDAIHTRWIDPHVDLILVGDSVGNAVLGFENTVPVTMDMMVHHTAAVNRASPNSIIVADLPFSLAYSSMDVLLASARRLLQEGGAQAIKIEVGHHSLFEKIELLVAAGIPVMAHIGLLPQNINALGSYRSYGNRESGKRRLIDWATQLQDCGCFCVLGEMIHPATAREITEVLQVPFIGIGCGPHCDGQILVLQDILGMSPSTPSFAKVYVSVGLMIQEAVANYADEVVSKVFPAE